MAESAKKISFAFSKVSKPSRSLQQIRHKEEEDVQYIDCLDSKEIVFKKYGLFELCNSFINPVDQDTFI
jgi:hypothetical protein